MNVPEHSRSDGEGLVEIDGEECYLVPDVDRMEPFLMSVISDGDRWMFISSAGPLTAGRVDAASALFPYETDDRLHAAVGRTGPVTRMRIATPAGEVVWRPFDRDANDGIRRLVARSVLGDGVTFEEHHEELALSLRTRWGSTEEHGFVRSATLTNHGATSVRIEVLDGLLGVLPHGLQPLVYQRLSNLTQAYKRTELVDPAVRLVVHSLESPVSDQPEPEEVLRATAVWSIGLGDADVVLDAGGVRAFDDGREPAPSALVTGRPGAHLLRSSIEIAPGESTRWAIVADVALDQIDVVGLRNWLRSTADPGRAVDDALRDQRDRLRRVMAPADAQQCTGDPVAGAHHLANVTYNVMRGGVPLDGYRIDTADFADFLTERNRQVAARHGAWLDALPSKIDRRILLDRVVDLGDVHLTRLAREYLPFSFSRRHGDPSRPWNAFSIRVRDDAGEPVVHYEGNWRDVFQNWEALCTAFPDFLPGVLATFVNASTADGHNPYRITRAGIDWEVPDPDDPWANIGYWGDHQIVYLHRLLVETDRYLPGEVARLLDERACTYADVPYRIASYEDLVRDPKSTIEFDADADAIATQRVAEIGGDGKLLRGADGELVVVTLLEKLLVAALAKLSNFVPGGGIWMNTQRPEWNDANNALVGHGLSMVTLCHLRQFLDHLRRLVADDPDATATISAEVASWATDVAEVLQEAPVDPGAGDADRRRRHVLDGLGRAGSDHRARLDDAGFSGALTTVTRGSIVELCDAAITHLDATIRGARRPDGLVHAYQLVDLSGDGTAVVEQLPKMLEGQVAVLGTGVLSPAEQVQLLDALAASDLYRPDQDTYLLAPVRRLPSFLDKNVIPDEALAADPLLSALIAAGERSIVRVDLDGRARFHPDLVDAEAVAAALDRLPAATWGELVERDRRSVLDVYERVVGHHAYLGRSGSMYAYEGIGSIYWHMVGKLLVAAQEAVVDAADAGAAPDVVDRLVDAYERVRAGLGFNKTAAEFGAIPTEPYSHTPAHAGAQQPGMTGAVKEELLARPLELGVRVRDGQIVFDPVLLRRAELLDEPRRWDVVTVDGSEVSIELPAGTLGLTVCQVPVVVGTGVDEPHVEIEFTGGRVERRSGRSLGVRASEMVFGRTGDVALIRAWLGPSDAD